VGDLAHPLVAVGLAKQPEGEADAVGDGDSRADESEENRVVAEEIQGVASLDT
jgi:hypothetical protein